MRRSSATEEHRAAPSPGNRGHQRSPAAWSREDIPRFWDKPEVRRQREHRIDQPTDEDRDYTLLEVFKHCTHHRIVCYDDNWEGDEFAYGVFSILWEAETNLVVLFGRNGSGKSLVVKEFRILFQERSVWRNMPYRLGPSSTRILGSLRRHFLNSRWV